MTLTLDPIQAVVFDYGNTLMQYAEPQLAAYGEALVTGLKELYGPFDTDRFYALRARSRMAPFEGESPTYRENDLTAITIQLVKDLFDREPTPEELDTLLTQRFNCFVDSIDVEPYVPEVLTRIKSRYTLGLLSNYPDGAAIRQSLDNHTLTDFFSSIVISGEVGFCKPHPLPFAFSLQDLKVSAQHVLFVGDNPLADINGAGKLGMQTVFISQWRLAREESIANVQCHPHATIGHLTELPELLKV